ncbi:NERD domain-containing protein (plasmid) [Paraburkholderia strydomiana]
MKQGKALFSVANEDAYYAAGCFDELAPGSKSAGNRDAWMAHRRRLSLALSKSVAALLRTMSDRAFVVRRGVMLEHAPGTRNPMTWVDCLAVTGFGSFVIGRYDWTGTVKRSLNDDELLVHDRVGVVSVQTSPLRRAKPAVRHLHALLAEYGCPVESIAVFASSQCVLDPALPEAILYPSELHHFMRTRLNRFRASHLQHLDAVRLAAHLELRCVDWGES